MHDYEITTALTDLQTNKQKTSNQESNQLNAAGSFLKS